MGNDILEGILKLVHTNLLILLLKYITQVTEKCIHNAGVGGSSPPVATNSFSALRAENVSPFKPPRATANLQSKIAIASL